MKPNKVGISNKLLMLTEVLLEPLIKALIKSPRLACLSLTPNNQRF